MQRENVRFACHVAALSWRARAFLPSTRGRTAAIFFAAAAASWPSSPVLMAQSSISMVFVYQ